MKLLPEGGDPTRYVLVATAVAAVSAALLIVLLFAFPPHHR